MIKSPSDYELALIKLLDSLPGREGEVNRIVRLFEERHLHEIAREHLQRTKSDAVRWDTNVRWARYHLVKKGMIDDTVRGVWQLTERGHQWLATNGNAPPPKKESVVKVSPAPKKKPAYIVQPAIASQDFTNAAPQKENERLSSILQREIKAIRSFLHGRTDQRPSDETLCDWVRFCYTFELYGEGRDLFRLIQEAEVNPWYYGRTRKLARICEMRSLSTSKL